MAKTTKTTEGIVEQVVMRPLADLIPNPKNPRTVQDEDVAALAESIKAHPRYFKARPILLSNRTGAMMIIAGERRSEAAKLLGMKLVPTILLEGLTEEQEDEIMIRDNTHAGKWDVAKLDVWNRFLLKKWGVDNLHREDNTGKDVEFEEKFKSVSNQNAMYPIVPRYDEDYEVICIVCKTSVDANYLREKLGMNKMKSYKNGNLGKSNVIAFEDIRNVID